MFHTLDSSYPLNYERSPCTRCDSVRFTPSYRSIGEKRRHSVCFIFSLCPLDWWYKDAQHQQDAKTLFQLPALQPQSLLETVARAIIYLQARSCNNQWLWYEAWRGDIAAPGQMEEIALTDATVWCNEVFVVREAAENPWCVEPWFVDHEGQ